MITCDSNNFCGTPDSLEISPKVDDMPIFLWLENLRNQKGLGHVQKHLCSWNVIIQMLSGHLENPGRNRARLGVKNVPTDICLIPTQNGVAKESLLRRPFTKRAGLQETIKGQGSTESCPHGVREVSS